MGKIKSKPLLLSSILLLAQSIFASESTLEKAAFNDENSATAKYLDDVIAHGGKTPSEPKKKKENSIPETIEEAIYTYDYDVKYLPPNASYEPYNERVPYKKDDPLVQFRLNGFDNSVEYWKEYIEFFKTYPLTLVRDAKIKEEQALLLDAEYDAFWLTRFQERYIEAIGERKATKRKQERGDYVSESEIRFLKHPEIYQTIPEANKYQYGVLRNISKISHRIKNCEELNKMQVPAMSGALFISTGQYFNHEINRFVDSCKDKQTWRVHNLKMAQAKKVLGEVKEDVAKTLDGKMWTFPSRAWYYFKAVFKTVFGIIDEDVEK